MAVRYLSGSGEGPYEIQGIRLNPNEVLIDMGSESYRLVAKEFSRNGNGKRVFSSSHRSRDGGNELLRITVYNIQKGTIGMVEEEIASFHAKRCDFSNIGKLRKSLNSTLENVAAIKSAQEIPRHTPIFSN